MRVLIRMFFAVVTVLASGCATTSPKHPFAELKALCDDDGARLWNASLCGPVLLVDPETRQFVANVAPLQAAATKDGDHFTGRLPDTENIANTTVEWAGVRWTELRLPLPTDAEKRRVLLAHESMHRLQAEAGWAFRDERGTNGHLDTLDGRYWLQLEWRALAKALSTDNNRAAIEDALAFRHARRAQVSPSADQESEIEWHEGLAEYTGVKLAVADAARQRALAIAGLEQAAQNDSFVRSFAYASGPAYGLLLDATGLDWRPRAARGEDLGALLTEAMKVTALPDATTRAAQYDGATLRASEEARDRAAKQRIAELTQKLITGPVLKLTLSKPNLQFNPNNLVSLGDAGTVYPTARVVDAWGVLTVTSDMLLDGMWSTATVTAPPGTGSWTLELNDGWQLVPASRTGDFDVRPK